MNTTGGTPVGPGVISPVHVAPEITKFEVAPVSNPNEVKFTWEFNGGAMPEAYQYVDSLKIYDGY